MIQSQDSVWQIEKALNEKNEFMLQSLPCTPLEDESFPIFPIENQSDYYQFCSQMVHIFKSQQELIQKLSLQLKQFQSSSEVPIDDPMDLEYMLQSKDLQQQKKQQKHRSFIDRMNHVFQMVRNKLVENKNLNIEIEFRFGKIQPKHFVSGTSKEFNEFVLKKLQSFGEWYRVYPCTNYEDYYYVLSNGTPVRTNVHFTFKQDPISKHLCEPCILTTHTTKTNLHAEYFKFGHELKGKEIFNEFRHLDSNYDIKLNVAIEDVVESKWIPKIENNIQHTRFKQRHSFEYKPSQAKMPVWRFDISQVWQGKTEREADLQCMYGTPIYEIELEILNPYYFLFELNTDDLDCSLSALYKILDLFGDEKEYIFFEPVKN